MVALYNVVISTSMITIEDTNIEKALKYLLQKDIIIRVQGKQWKTGKMLLFNQSGFYVEVILDGPKRQERFEVPIPFEVEVWHADGLVYFDYMFSTLARGNKQLESIIHGLKSDRKSRFYNAVMEIEVKR